MGFPRWFEVKCKSTSTYTPRSRSPRVPANISYPTALDSLELVNPGKAQQPVVEVQQPVVKAQKLVKVHQPVVKAHQPLNQQQPIYKQQSFKAQQQSVMVQQPTSEKKMVDTPFGPREAIVSTQAPGSQKTILGGGPKVEFTIDQEYRDETKEHMAKNNLKGLSASRWA